MNLPQLIRRGRDLDQQIKEASEELKKIKGELIAAGAGEHEGTDGAKALVIFPSPSIKPGVDDVTEARRLLTPKQFGKLFIETVTVTAVKAFREVAAAVLEEKKAREVIELCEKDGSPQVRFS